MTNGICNQSVIPVRSEPSHKSEIVTQLLFGELFEVIEKQNEWIRIRCDYDHYSGWIVAAQAQLVDLFEYENIKKKNSFLCYELVGVLDNGNPFPVVLASNLPYYDHEKCCILDKYFYYDGAAKNILHPDTDLKKLVENALMYLNAPYLWGGRSPFGIDCSGLTQNVFKLAGIALKRDAYLQAEQGEQVHLLDETHPGDLAFFENEEGRITHVGLLMNDHKIIHASGKVRIDNIDHFGIYNDEMKKYSHKLRMIRRMI
ncbi:MAG: C40 family peptidase [Bacteroidia bacterium]